MTKLFVDLAVAIAVLLAAGQVGGCLGVPGAGGSNVEMNMEAE